MKYINKNVLFIQFIIILLYPKHSCQKILTHKSIYLICLLNKYINFYISLLFILLLYSLFILCRSVLLVHGILIPLNILNLFSCFIIIFNICAVTLYICNIVTFKQEGKKMKVKVTNYCFILWNFCIHDAFAYILLCKLTT
jgi:hypothetical protein